MMVIMKTEMCLFYW